MFLDPYFCKKEVPGEQSALLRQNTSSFWEEFSTASISEGIPPISSREKKNR